MPTSVTPTTPSSSSTWGAAHRSLWSTGSAPRCWSPRAPTTGRVVQAESDNIVAPLRARGVPVEYLVADDEGHGFENPENQIMLFHAIERHLAAHLGGRSAQGG